MNMNLDEAIKILTGEYPTHQKEEAIKVIYKLVEESAYYRDLVKLERKEKQHLKKSLKGQIAVKDTEINKLNNIIDELVGEVAVLNYETIGEWCNNDKGDKCKKCDTNNYDCIKEYFMKEDK